MPTISTYAGALVEPHYESGVLTLVPCNSKGKECLDAFFAAETGNTTVAIAQIDAGRSGFADTTQPYKGITLTIS